MKFNDQNGCTETEVNKFMEMPFKNKVFFTCKHWSNENGGVHGYSPVPQA